MALKGSGVTAVCSILVDVFKYTQFWFWSKGHNFQEVLKRLQETHQQLRPLPCCFMALFNSWAGRDAEKCSNMFKVTQEVGGKASHKTHAL